jgi:hypothetical protein
VDGPRFPRVSINHHLARIRPASPGTRQDGPARARSGDPIAICEYLGEGDAFDRAITDFSQRYADQNEKDYQQFITAARSGRLEVIQGV